MHPRAAPGLRTAAGLLAAVAAFAAAGCGGGGGGAIDPGALGSCEEVADAAAAVMQDSIDAMDAAAAGTEPEPSDVAGIEELGAALEERARALGCGEAEMAGLMAERADDLHAESVLGQLIIEGLRAGDAGGGGGS